MDTAKNDIFGQNIFVECLLFSKTGISNVFLLQLIGKTQILTDVVFEQKSIAGLREYFLSFPTKSFAEHFSTIIKKNGGPLYDRILKALLEIHDAFRRYFRSML